MSEIIEFKNPIIPGFAPDPSVVLVKDTFYLVNSSFHIFPGLPIYASRDLQNWKHIGNAINRRSQINLKHSSVDGFPLGPNKVLIAAGGLFAPTIRWHKGTFYIICTNSSSDGTNLTMQNFYISTTDPWKDSWSDPIFFDFQGIDPSLFFDDEDENSDRVYIQGSWRAGPVSNPMCTIRQVEINIRTGKALSETKEIWEGFLKKGDVEGPHVYKKDGFYYLLTAEGGTFEHHMIAMARSRNIWGPYESYEKNPVLTAYGTEEYIQHTGHGDLFQDGHGEWWITCLGVRNEEGRYPLGRETFLAPVNWPEGGWPEISHPRKSFTHRRISLNSEPLPKISTEKTLRVGDVYIRDVDPSEYQISEDGKTIIMKAGNTDLSAPIGTTTFLGKRQRHLCCTAEVSLQLPNPGAALHCGLALYKEDFRHVSIYYDSEKSSICLRNYQKLKGEPKVTQHHVQTGNSISFRIDANEKVYQFWYQLETEWIAMGSVDTLEMTAYDFTGTIFGIFALALNDNVASMVSFKDFDVAQKT